LLLNLLVLLLIVVIFVFPYDTLRVIIGVPFVLFFPGYVVMLVLFPKREGVGGIERIALSFGTSLAVVPLLGFVLNYLPWGITLESIIYSTVSFIFVVSLFAWLRRRRIRDGERFDIDFRLMPSGWGENMSGRILSVVLVIAILGVLGTLGYAIAVPKVGEKFTEFYILGEEGEAADYPQELKVGEEGKVVVGIINREYRAVPYRVEVRVNGAKSSEVGPLMLENNEEWEGEIGFVPQVTGENQKVEFLLYKEGQSEIYRTLHLWVDVIELR